MHRQTGIQLLVAAALLWGCDAQTYGGHGSTSRGTTDSDGGSSRPPPRMDGDEVCNELDDDGDREVDEGCECEVGETQSCWPGEPSVRGRGECRDGTQECVLNGEFPGWGPCTGYTVCSDVCLPTAEVCDSGSDEDCDGLADCDDPDCETDFACGMCAPESPYEEASLVPRCKDGEDNDCDGLVDCRDPDCSVPGLRESVCSDGLDDDCDGLIDCDDPDCGPMCGCGGVCLPGSQRWCDEPIFCAWGKQDCLPDGSWGRCREVLDRPRGCFGLFYDRDCCVAAGECCQNYPFDDSSVGSCSSTAPRC